MCSLMRMRNSDRFSVRDLELVLDLAYKMPVVRARCLVMNYFVSSGTKSVRSHLQSATDDIPEGRHSGAERSPQAANGFHSTRHQETLTYLRQFGKFVASYQWNCAYVLEIKLSFSTILSLARCN